MVCIAAFIILCVISVGVGFLSIFKRDIGRKWWKVFKKAWHCVFKKVRLQKCDTNFKDDVKNTILKKVVIKHPKWVKPISVGIEILSVVIVAVTVWSIVIAVKSLLALWVFGTCNVTQPAQCSLGAEVCSIDEQEAEGLFGKIGQSIGEWGEIFGAIPDRLHSWEAEDYLFDVFGDRTAMSLSSKEGKDGGALAVDIMDPGCAVCLQSYKNQVASGFMDTHDVILLVYPIKLPDGSEKFANSELIARYLIAAGLYSRDIAKTDTGLARSMVNRIFTEYNSGNVIYQAYLQSLSAAEAEGLLKSWLKEFQVSPENVQKISALAQGEEVSGILAQAREMVENKVHAKGIPTLIYDGKKHNGLFKG